MKLFLRQLYLNGIVTAISWIVIFITKSIFYNDFFNPNIYFNADIIFLTGSTIANLLVSRNTNNLFCKPLNIVDVLYLIYCTLLYAFGVIQSNNVIACLIMWGVILFFVIFFAETIVTVISKAKANRDCKRKYAYANTNFGYKKEDEENETDTDDPIALDDWLLGWIGTA